MTMYAKLFASLYQGTLRGRSNEILVFTNLLAHAARDGTVDKHWRAIAEETGLSIDEVKSAIVALESPDPESRSAEENGARIVQMDGHRAWGWRIVNHGKYRAIRSEDDRAEQNRIAQEKWRNKNKPSSATSNTDKPMQRQYAEAEAEANTKATASPSGVGEEKKDRLPTTPTAKRIATMIGRRLTTAWSEKEIKAFKAIGQIPEEDLQTMEAYYNSDCQYLRRDLSTLLNNWPGELDRAWAHGEQQQPRHRALSGDVDPEGWREFLSARNQDYAPWKYGKGYLKDEFTKMNKPK